jgi:hypothetical protein
MWAEQTLSTFRVATGPFRVLPDFLIIGAPKCGTTSLYHYLVRHPSVEPAFRKEVRYFNKSFERGTSWYRAHFPAVPYRFAVRAFTRRRVLVGESTPLYLFDADVADRVRALLPAAKLIVLLRDPVERAYSGYQMEVRNGREKHSFIEAIEREADRLRREGNEGVGYKATNGGAPEWRSGYLARGMYADRLAEWFRLFPREQFFIVTSEDFFSDTNRVFAQVIDFLGIEPWQPDQFKQYNAAKYSSMEPAARRWLIEYFTPHNERLYRLLGHDFGSQWQKRASAADD